uniref:UPF3 domain-containing protein n=1 Tax=Cannabis sativa TaxID=3483 RepID=A0A803NLQ5_CANSA
MSRPLPLHRGISSGVRGSGGSNDFSDSQMKDKSEKDDLDRRGSSDQSAFGMKLPIRVLFPENSPSKYGSNENGFASDPLSPRNRHKLAMLLLKLSLAFIILVALSGSFWWTLSISTSSRGQIFVGYRRLQEQLVSDLWDIGELSLGSARVKDMEFCPQEFENHVPCYNNNVSESGALPLSDGQEYPRNCMRGMKQNCLVLPPVNYKIPLRWPTGRDIIWLANVKITAEEVLSSGSLTKRMMLLDKEQISFRSASPMFDGVEDYSHQIAEMIGLRNESNFIEAGVREFLKHQRYSRAYIDFTRAEDVLEFAEFFDGHVFVNEKGVQYKTIVEYAPSQRVPKLSSRRDGREGTIIKDPDYLEFLKIIAKPAEHLPSAEIQLERKEAEQAGAAKETPIITPLMEYVRQKRAVGNGAQGSVVVGKVSRRSGAGSSRKRQPSSSTKKVSEKKKYILKDKTRNTSRKDKSNFTVVPRREDQLTTSIGKEISEIESVSAIEGSFSGIPVIADSGKKKILLLKGKRPETTQQQETSLGNSSVSGSPKQNQRREASGRLIRSILLNNESRQGQSSTAGQPQQKIENLNIENVKRLPRNMRGLNGQVSHHELNSLKSEGDRKKDLEDKFMKKGQHNGGNVSEKQEKRTRNKDRPDRGVWAPLRRADVSHTSDERMSSSVLQSTQLPSDTVEGSHRNVGHRGTVNNIKDEIPQNASEGKSSKRVAAVHGAHEFSLSSYFGLPYAETSMGAEIFCWFLVCDWCLTALISFGAETRHACGLFDCGYKALIRGVRGDAAMLGWRSAK